MRQVLLRGRVACPGQSAEVAGIAADQLFFAIACVMRTAIALIGRQAICSNQLRSSQLLTWGAGLSAFSAV